MGLLKKLGRKPLSAKIILSQSKILIAIRHFLVKNIHGLIPCILGFGVYPLMIPAIIVTSFFGTKKYPRNLMIMIHKPGYLTLLMMIFLFLGCYWGLYTPYSLEPHNLQWAYFPTLSILCITTLLWVGCLQKNIEIIGFIWFFCLGALIFCLITVGMTILYATPPFYSNAIDIRYLFLGIKKSINTPGISNLLCLFPTAFIAGLILKPNERPCLFWSVGIVGFSLSIAAAVLIGQRSYFVIVFVIDPIIAGVFLLIQRSWHSFFAVVLSTLTLPLMMLLNESTTISFVLKRFQEHRLIHDGRFQMLQYWIKHLLANPLDQIKVGPEAWAHLQWFHNFFADVHRLSGFWALLAAITLIALIFYRLIHLIKTETRLGFFLATIATTCLLIINTSVVPEGEKQPFLLLLAIGAITEVVLARERHKVTLD